MKDERREAMIGAGWSNRDWNEFARSLFPQIERLPLDVSPHEFLALEFARVYAEGLEAGLKQAQVSSQENK